MFANYFHYLILAADALSVRFQSSLSGSPSPIPNIQQSAKNVFSSRLGFQQEHFPSAVLSAQSYPSQPVPENCSASGLFPSFHPYDICCIMAAVSRQYEIYCCANV